MTTTEIRARLGAIAAEENRLTDEKYALRLALEESEGRPDSHEARYARAYLAGNLSELDALCAEGDAAYVRKYGRWPQQDIREAAERLLATDSPAAASTATTNHPGAEQQ